MGRTHRITAFERNRVTRARRSALSAASRCPGLSAELLATWLAGLSSNRRDGRRWRRKADGFCLGYADLKGCPHGNTTNLVNRCCPQSTFLINNLWLNVIERSLDRFFRLKACESAVCKRLTAKLLCVGDVSCKLRRDMNRPHTHRPGVDT